jgi:DNA-binding transcriptional MerR regulator
MNKPADLKPRNLSAAVRLRLNEIENWLDRGLTRHEIAEILDSEYSFSVTAKGLEMALYRTRQNRKNVLHNTHDKSSAKGAAESVLHNTQPSEPEAQESEKQRVPALLIKNSSIKSVRISTLRSSTTNSEVIYEVAVINYSGSVRKTLISSYLLAPRLTGAKFYAVETINQSASDLGIENVTSFKGDDFSRLIEG